MNPNEYATPDPNPHGTERDFAAADLDHQAALNERLRRYELGGER